MANTVVLRGGVAAALLLLHASTALGQRMTFPTAVDPNGSPPLASALAAPSTAPGTVYPAPSPAPSIAPGWNPPANPAYAPGAVPGYRPFGTPASTPGTAPMLAPGVAPALAPGPAPMLAPGPTPGLTGAPPSAMLQGTIQAPGWDPYAAPGPQTQPLFPTDPFAQPGSPFGTTAPLTRFRQELRVDSHWLARGGSQPFGTEDSELSGTFAFPFFYNQQTPLLITPGFAVHLWDGPVSTGPDPPDLPPRAYDAYLEAAWLPQPTPWLGADLAFRIGVYSDFSKVTTRSIRFPSHGLAVLSFSPSFQVKAGVFFLDRNHIKLLPAGGIVWTPNKDIRFDVLFPNPKLAKHLTTIGTAEWWIYARGEYGGGAWTVKRGVDGPLNSVDYNDIRVAAGVEFERSGGLHGTFEVGLAFDREIFYVETPLANIHPSPTFFLGGSIAF